MSKAVLISIRPEWCKKIAGGQKTVEIRKTAPNLKKPFKCYIYCTKSTHFVDIPGVKESDLMSADGKVIGEFTCYSTTIICHAGATGSRALPKLHIIGPGPGLQYKPANDLLKAACMSEEAAEEYLKGGSGFGWGVSGLKIYDRPHELCEFTGLRKTRFGMEPVKLDRPPQSWRYIEMEELDDDGRVESDRR